MRNTLKAIRLKRNLTQDEVAKLIGIDRSSYTKIELGTNNPSLEVAFKIKKVLKYSNDDIFLNIE